MIVREKYLSEIRGFYDSDLIKVITGIRRCGKSVILDEIIDEIKKKTDNIIYLNFETVSVLNKIHTYLDLISYVNDNRKDGKCYVFLDEVQVLTDWAIAVKDLRLHNNSIFVTGSNSKLLSSEFLTLLSGREISFRIRPFVYKEIKEYASELGKDVSVQDYLIWGGFPKRFEYNNEKETKAYLNELENTIVINDLIARYKIRKDMLFKQILNFIFINNSRIFSSLSIYNYIKNEDATCSINTIIKYLGYLKEAYVIDEIQKYSTKTKRELKYNPKLYLSDVSFNSLRVSNNRYDFDHNIENVVYNELLYMGYSLKTFDNKGKEIDFIANKDGKIYYIQVAYSVVDLKAYDREFNAFKDMDNLNQKILITNDENDYSTSTIRHIKLKDFLLMKDLDTK